jgi:desulfoferrodoxin (superoxide reductase-like protein)
MKYAKRGIGLAAAVLVLFGSAQMTLANKSSVKIEAPGSVQKGSEITIKLNVSHSGNSFFHHTDWAYIKINGIEVARWEYSSSNKPEAADFTKEIKYTVEQTAEIVAEAHCNIHGSAGPAEWTVTVK